jgi:hypothetical protein
MTSPGKKAVKVIPAARRLIRYSRLIARWWLVVQWGRLAAVLRRRSGTIRRASIVLWGIGLGLLAAHYGAGSITKDALTNYLVATAAMIGGTTAIVFSVTIFLLQGVSDLYSSKHFDAYVNNWRDLQAIYVVIIAIAIGLFAGGLYVAELKDVGNVAALVIVVSLGLVGAVFALIDRQYELVRRKLSPAEVISFLRTKAMGFLRRTERNAARIAELLRLPNQELPTESALAVAYNRVLRPAISDLGRQIELLVDMSLRLSEREEIETAKFALTAAGEVICGYLAARKTSSIAMRSSVALLVLESDSQSFLAGHYEQLNRAGERFIRDGRDDLAAHVVDVYLLLANAAKDVEHIGSTNENPILEQVMWSLTFYARSGSPSPNLEVLFQATKALRAIAEMAASTGLDATLLGIQENLAKLAMSSLVHRTTVVVNEATTAFLTIITAAFNSNDVDRKFAVERSLQGIADIAVVLTTLIEGGAIANDYATTESLVKGYTDLHAVLNDVLTTYDTLCGNPEKARYRSDVVMLFEALRSHFRRLTKDVSPDSLLAGSIARLILRINAIIIALIEHPEFGDVRKKLHDCLKWLAYSPYWFFDASPGFDPGGNSPRTLADSVAHTGVLAWKRSADKSIVEACIKSVEAMATKALEKATESNGYGEPRLLEKACYLGILAMKSGWMDVVADLKAKIGTFEQAYVKKYLENVEGVPDGFNPYDHAVLGLPHANQLALELENWASRFDYERYNGVRISGEAEDEMYELIEEADIRRFIHEIWGR